MINEQTNTKNNGRKGVEEKGPPINDPPIPLEIVEHPITAKELNTMGRSVMSNRIAWYPEPIYPSRRAEIEQLINNLESLANATGVPELSWRCHELRARLERAVTSARKLLESLSAAELDLIDQEGKIEKERTALKNEVDDLHQQIEAAEAELKKLVKEAQETLAKAGLTCNEVSMQSISQSIEEVAPTPEEFAGALGVTIRAKKTIWEQILALPTDIAPLAIGLVVAVALGLIAGVVDLRALKEFTNPGLLGAMFVIGVTITATMAEGLATIVRIWAPSIIKRQPDFPAQLNICRKVLIAGAVIGCMFVLCETVLEGLGFLRMHSLITLAQQRMSQGAAKVQAQSEIAQTAASLYFCLGFIVTTPVILLKVGKAIMTIQEDLVGNFINENIRRWKQDKRSEITTAVVLAEECDASRSKIVQLTSRCEAVEKNIAVLVSAVIPPQITRITILEEQARGKASKFWQLFDAAVQPPDARWFRTPSNTGDITSRDNHRRLSRSRRSLKQLLRLLFGIFS